VLSRKVRQFVPTRITADVDALPPSERATLQTLIEAARLMDPIFDRQAWADNPRVREAVAQDTSAEGKLRLAYFDIMRGPWDRNDHHRPFATDGARPPGGGFYPDDITETEFRAWIEAHPPDRERFESPFTAIERRGDVLEAVPYSQRYAEWLEPAAALLQKAAQQTSSPSLQSFLRSRARAFASDDYYASDKDWMDLDGQVEITIGPYEAYEDELFNLKAAFEAFVTVVDPGASADLARYKNLLPVMEDNLPIPDDVKTKRGGESPIRVVDLVFTAGDARRAAQTMAFNLPNDERVRAEKGSKKVLLRNVIQAKFDAILVPIAERILDASQLEHLSRDAFFQETLFHELSHSLGPAYTMQGDRRVEVRLALESTYSAIEECKADVMGAYNVLFMIDRGEFPAAFRPKLLVSYLVGLFRSTRFGVSEAHGQGAAVQINRFLEEGATRFDETSGTFTVDLERLERSIRTLVADLCLLQHRGDRQAARELLARYGTISPPMARALGSLAEVPIDLRPIYPAAGETG
jgi:hypothetical protein